MNLENLGVQEMNADELISIDGGYKRWLYRTAASVAEWIISNPQETVSSGWDSIPYGHYGGARP